MTKSKINCNKIKMILEDNELALKESKKDVKILTKIIKGNKETIKKHC